MSHDFAFRSVAVLLLFTTLAFSLPSRAEILFLTCNSPKYPTRTLTIDLANKTVNNLPASINLTSIDWKETDVQVGGTAIYRYHIDRASGVFTQKAQTRFDNGRLVDMGESAYDCNVGNPPPTKF
jgi:hypothetical protein